MQYRAFLHTMLSLWQATSTAVQRKTKGEKRNIISTLGGKAESAIAEDDSSARARLELFQRSFAFLFEKHVRLDTTPCIIRCCRLAENKLINEMSHDPPVSLSVVSSDL